MIMIDEAWVQLRFFTSYGSCYEDGDPYANFVFIF